MSSIYRLFEDKDESDDLFGSLLINVKTYTFPHEKLNINVYVVCGDRIEHDDHELLKELYDYRTICQEIFNKEYFRIIMTENKLIMVLFDYRNKFKMTNRISHIRSSTISSKLPYELSQLINKESSDWRGYSALQSGIRYTNGNSSNLSLYDWKYGHGSTYTAM